MANARGVEFMAISGVQSNVFSMSSYQYAKTKAPIKNTAIEQQKSDPHDKIYSNESQNYSDSIENDSYTQNTNDAALSLEQAKEKGPLGLTYNRYQWAVSELTGYRDELLSGRHFDPAAFLLKSMSTLKSMNLTPTTGVNVKIDSSAPEIIFKNDGPTPKYVNTPQEVMNFITEEATSFSSRWINMVKQDTTSLINDVQNVTNQTMGKNYNWLDLSSKGLGLNNIGTNTDEIVSKIDKAVSILNGYCGAIGEVLKKVPGNQLTMSCPWSCVLDLPTISFRV